MAVTGFAEEQFKGGKVRFTSNQNCIANYQFSFEQLHSEWVLAEESSLTSNLRKKRID
jgi:hypothetical protein